MKWQHPAVGHWTAKDGGFTCDLKLMGELWHTLVTFEGDSIFFTRYIDRDDAMSSCVQCIVYERHLRDPNRIEEDEDA